MAALLLSTKTVSSFCQDYHVSSYIFTVLDESFCNRKKNKNSESFTKWLRL